MAKRRKAVPREVSTLRSRVDEWRQTRRRGQRMPDELWATAARLASKHGPRHVSRALGVNYGRLTKRVEAATGTAVALAGECGGGFVEFSGAQLSFDSRPGEAVIELVDTDGASMQVRRPASEVDLLELAASFWRRHT